MVVFLQLSMDSFKRILDFNLTYHGFKITSINTKLNHIFVLATTGQHTLGESERIKHTLTAYACINQPEEKTQWVRLQIDRFEEGLVPNAQSLMNSAALKYVNILANGSSSFGGSRTNIRKHIVSMMADVSKKISARPTSNKKIATSDDPNPKSAKTLLPFVCHFKARAVSDAATLKVNDTKEWKGETWLFAIASIIGIAPNGILILTLNAVLFRSVWRINIVQILPLPLPIPTEPPLSQTSLTHQLKRNLMTLLLFLHRICPS